MKCLAHCCVQLVFAGGDDRGVPVAPGHGHLCVQVGLQECLSVPAEWLVFAGVSLLGGG